MLSLMPTRDPKVGKMQHRAASEAFVFSELANLCQFSKTEVQAIWDLWNRSYIEQDLALLHEFMIAWHCGIPTRIAAITQGRPTVSVSDRLSRVTQGCCNFLGHIGRKDDAFILQQMIGCIFPQTRCFDRFAPQATALYVALAFEHQTPYIKCYLNSRLTNEAHQMRVVQFFEHCGIPADLVMPIFNATHGDHIHWRGIGFDLHHGIARPKIYIQSNCPTLISIAQSLDNDFSTRDANHAQNIFSEVLAPRSELALQPNQAGTLAKLTLQLAANAPRTAAIDAFKSIKNKYSFNAGEIYKLTQVLQPHASNSPYTRFGLGRTHEGPYGNIYFI